MLAVCLVLSAPVWGQRESLVLLHPGIFRVLNDSLEFFEDSTKSLDVEAVRNLPPTAYLDRRHLKFILGYTPSILWARVRLANPHAQPQSVVLEVVNPFVPTLGCYQVHPGQPADTLLLSGAKWPFHCRHQDFQRRNFMCPLTVAAYDTCEVYLSIGKDFLPNANILLTDRDIREGYVRRLEDILLTLFFVFCAVYLVLSAFIFTATRQDVQWYYFTYVLITVCFVSTHLGHGFQYLWPDMPLLQFVIPPTLNLLRLIFGIRFFQLYFDIANRSRRLNLMFTSTIVLFALASVAQLAYVLCAFEQWEQPMPTHLYRSIQPLMRYAYLGFCLYLVLFSLIILVWSLHEITYRRRRYPVALFVVVGLNFAGLVLAALQYIGSDALDLMPDALLRSNRLTYTTQTFYIPAPILLGFFLEILLVFNFSMRRYVRLFEKDQRAQLKIAKAREEGLNALLLGVENERRRIARDLHDSACVNLAAIRMKVNVLREQLPPGQAALLAQMGDIADDLELTYREVREVSHDFMSKTLEKMDFTDALDDLLLHARQAQPGLQIECYINYPLHDISKMARIHLYRIIQELLSNVLRHAHATHVAVQLLRSEDNLLLSIEDDGSGFDPQHQASPEAGIGLANIRTRVEVLHGQMHLDSAPQKGTFISITVPKEQLEAD